MEEAILLAVAASLCTATSSVCQRTGARSSPPAGFDLWLVFRLARQPVWLLGIASMILGFVFQLTGLRYGDLALVQPILAAELLFVFGYLALAGSRRIKPRDRLATAGTAGPGRSQLRRNVPGPAPKMHLLAREGTSCASTVASSARNCHATPVWSR